MKFTRSPVTIPRRLVAFGRRVYVTLGYAAPLTSLDAATGKTVTTYDGTAGTDEVLYADGVLVLWLCDDQATWGCFAGLEAFLQESGIPFTRRHDGGAMYDRELIEYHPGSKTVCLLTNSSGEPIVVVSSLMPVDAALARALEHLNNDRQTDANKSLKKALAMLRRQLPPATPPLEPFEIDNER